MLIKKIPVPNFQTGGVAYMLPIVRYQGRNHKIGQSLRGKQTPNYTTLSSAIPVARRALLTAEKLVILFGFDRLYSSGRPAHCQVGIIEKDNRPKTIILKDCLPLDVCNICSTALNFCKALDINQAKIISLLEEMRRTAADDCVLEALACISKLLQLEQNYLNHLKNVSSFILHNVKTTKRLNRRI